MIEIIEINILPQTVRTNQNCIPVNIGYKYNVQYLLFDKHVCNCEFKSKEFLLDLKSYIENQLKEDFNKNK